MGRFLRLGSLRIDINEVLWFNDEGEAIEFCFKNTGDYSPPILVYPREGEKEEKATIKREAPYNIVVYLKPQNFMKLKAFLKLLEIDYLFPTKRKVHD